MKNLLSALLLVQASLLLGQSTVVVGAGGQINDTNTWTQKQTFNAGVAFSDGFSQLTSAPGIALDARECDTALATQTTNDVTTALNACMTTAFSAGKALFIPYLYWVNYFRIPAGGKVICADSRTAGFKEIALGTGLSGVAAPTDGQIATVATADLAATVGVTIQHCYIDGNKTQVLFNNPSAQIEGLRISNENAVGGGTVKPRHNLQNITVINTTGTGVEIGAITRDSRFDNFVVYGANGYGLLDNGVDAERQNWNIGQSLYDGVRSTANIVRYTNFKSWGSGQYNVSAENPDGSYAANFYFWKVTGIVADNLQSQEAQGYGFRVEGNGTNEAVEFSGTNLLSDGDNVAASGLSCMNAFRLRNSQIRLTCGKLAAGLAGTPLGALVLSTSSGNDIAVNYTLSGITSYAVAIGSESEGLNRITANNNPSQWLAASYAASYTPRPDQHWNESITLTGNISFVNPPKMHTGDHIRLYLTQDATGTRTYTWDTFYKLPTGCTPDKTANKLEVFDFEINSATTAVLISPCPAGI